MSLLTPLVKQMLDHISYAHIAKGLDLGIVQPELAYLGLCLLLSASALCALCLKGW